MNKILIVTEKQGTRYFDASTTELLHAAAFKILKERWDEEYWYTLDEQPSSEGILTKEQIESIPIESIRVQEYIKLKDYTQQVKHWKRGADEYYNIKKAISDVDHKSAWRLLLNRSDGEYEEVDVVDLEEA